MTTQAERKQAQLADAEAFVRDIQGDTTGQYTVVYPFTLDDLRNARRYVRLLKKDLREFDNAAEYVANTCESLLNQ